MFERYFKPKPNIGHIGWGTRQQGLFYEGIKEYGVGEWKTIKDRYPELVPYDLRQKLMRLIGRQDLGEYSGLKLTEDEIAAQKKRNLAISHKQAHLWKNGMLVKDEKGTVEKQIKSTSHTLDAARKRTASSKTNSTPTKKRKVEETAHTEQNSTTISQQTGFSQELQAANFVLSGVVPPADLGLPDDNLPDEPVFTDLLD